LKSEYADKIEEKKNQLLKEAEQEQQELKGDLQTRRQSEKLKIEAEDEKRLQNELTVLIFSIYFIFLYFVILFVF
jgi:hypothetical protein